MKRSPGVTVSAVIALIGSILTLLVGILTLVIMMFVPIPESAEAPASPVFMKALFAALSLMYMLPAIWGIATSVGFFRLKNWARISMIVFSVILVAMSGFSGLISLLMPMPPTPDSHVPASIMVGIRIFMGVFWLSLLGLGIWWLVFFPRAGIKAQFALQPSTVIPGPPPLPGASQTLGVPTEHQARRGDLSVSRSLPGCCSWDAPFFHSTSLSKPRWYCSPRSSLVGQPLGTSRSIPRSVSSPA